MDCDISDVNQDEHPATSLSTDETEKELIEDWLIEHQGPNYNAETLEALERLIDQIAISRAGEAMRRIVRCLGNTPAGKALERVLLGDDGNSLEADAKDLGCTKQNLAYHENRVRERLPTITNAFADAI